MKPDRSDITIGEFVAGTAFGMLSGATRINTLADSILPVNSDMGEKYVAGMVLSLLVRSSLPQDRQVRLLKRILCRAKTSHLPRFFVVKFLFN